MARNEHSYIDFEERFAGKDVSDKLSEAPWNDLETLRDAGIAVSVTKDDLRHCYWVYVNDSDPGYPCLTLERAAYFISGLCLGITGTCYHIIDYHKHQPMWLSKEQRREAMEWEEDDGDSIAIDKPDPVSGQG